MEIKNVEGFFIGLIILIIGTFIIVFDFPQIQYFDKLEVDEYFLLDTDTKKIHERLKIEFSVGVIILVAGITLSICSFLKKLKK